MIRCFKKLNLNFMLKAHGGSEFLLIVHALTKMVESNTSRWRKNEAAMIRAIKMGYNLRANSAHHGFEPGWVEKMFFFCAGQFSIRLI